MSIKDLKGKIVYMNVWATWCGPCIDEVPASKKLQQEFLNDNIQFLNVSIDGDKSDWDKFLKEDKSWKGLHIIIEHDKVQSFLSSFKLYGIPGYMLIDPSGNIANVKAPRPSEKKAKEEIELLLAKQD